ncbi:hypothetical protein HN51_052798, partial [Arachis hypogaea]
MLTALLYRLSSILNVISGTVIDGGASSFRKRYNNSLFFSSIASTLSIKSFNPWLPRRFSAVCAGIDRDVRERGLLAETITHKGGSNSTLINSNEGNEELTVGKVVIQERSK